MPILAKIRDRFRNFLPNDVAKLRAQVSKVDQLEFRFAELSDEEIRITIGQLKAKQTSNLDEQGAMLKALAICRELTNRVLGLRAFDTQLMSAIALYQGKFVEMATGEGKTMVAIFAAFLNHLKGLKTHIAVPNPYLATRDMEWTRPVFEKLTMTSSLVTSEQIQRQKREAYSCDVVYSTFAELGFDYLRDNTKKSLSSMVQNGHDCVILDEVDSILIDEGRTPLVLSVPATLDTHLFSTIDEIICALTDGDYEFNTKKKWANFTDVGVDKLEKQFAEAGIIAAGTVLHDGANILVSQLAIQSLKAHKVFKRGEDYVLIAQDVVLLDEKSGRLMQGRKLADGLHQAIEAKEKIDVKTESRSIASISVQNFFKLYHKISGMSGTIMTDSDELGQIFQIESVKIPTHRPLKRIDRPDHIAAELSEKNAIIIDKIVREYRRGRPILIGTATIEQSVKLSDMLSALTIPHNVLNAYHTDNEARIISEAGRFGAVTVSTNMAGRGTDIQLGGNLQRKLLNESGAATPERLDRLQTEHVEEVNLVCSLGGLLIIATEKSVCRRVDNQLRGRAGRQGDPGESIFILSFEDEFLKNADEAFVLLAGETALKDPQQAVTEKVMERRRKVFRSVQSRLENDSFRTRLNLLKLDNVLNEQRLVIYKERKRILTSPEIASTAASMRSSVVEEIVNLNCGLQNEPEWNISALLAEFAEVFSLDDQYRLRLEMSYKHGDRKGYERELSANLNQILQERYSVYSAETLDEMYRVVLLEVLDEEWRQHFNQLETLMSNIALRSIGKRDPVVEFKTEAFGLFEEMSASLPRSFCSKFYAQKPKNISAQNSVLKDLISSRF